MPSESSAVLETTRFYENHIRRYGYGYRALGFGRRSSQEKRFQSAATLGDFHGKRLLDVGCGFGDLLAWLRARGVQPRYTGLDLTASMIERCRKRFAEGGSEGAARFAEGSAYQRRALELDTDYRPARLQRRQRRIDGDHHAFDIAA